MSLSGMNLIGQTVELSPETKMWTNRWMDKRTNEQTEFHQFQKEPRYDGGLSPC